MQKNSMHAEHLNELFFVFFTLINFMEGKKKHFKKKFNLNLKVNLVSFLFFAYKSSILQ